MRKTIVSMLALMLFFSSKAQVATFLSLQSATSWKDATGDFVEAKEWIGAETYIDVDLSKKKIQFFSKGMLDRDPLSFQKELFILNKGSQPEVADDKMVINFAGIDGTGKKCIIRLQLLKNEYKMLAGELRVEYVERAETYKIRTSTPGQKLNKS